MKTYPTSKLLMSTIAAALTLTTSSAAWAGQAETSATAGSNGRGPGTAAATAEYHGDGIGFTKTKAESGRLNIARGLSVGFDRDGLDLSHSYAVAPKYGPAIGGTFNMHIGADGRGSIGVGQVSSQGDPERSVSVGGSTGRRQASAWAQGETGHRGEVRASTYARELGPERRITLRPVERQTYRRVAGR